MAMFEEFDLHIDENDGTIYRHFPPEHRMCTPTFDPEGVDLEQSETELIEIFEAMKVEINRLREVISGRYQTGGRTEIDYQNELARLRRMLDFTLEHCAFFADGTKTCDSFWHDKGHSSHSTCPSCNGGCDAPRGQVTKYTRVSERVAEMLTESEATMTKTRLQKIRVIFDKAGPGDIGGRFVEVEDLNHRGMRVGEWIKLDGEYEGMWALELTAIVHATPKPNEETTPVPNAEEDDKIVDLREHPNEDGLLTCTIHGGKIRPGYLCRKCVDNEDKG